MTAHELAKMLSDGPDWPVVVVDWAEGYYSPMSLEARHIRHPYGYETYRRTTDGKWVKEICSDAVVALGVGK